MLTDYQMMLVKRTKDLSAGVAANLDGSVVPLNIGLKTVLTGEDVALPSEDVAEVERRFRSIRVEVKATGELEEFFARRVATMTVRVERGVRQESVTLSDKVRRAVADFDSARFTEAARLYDWITADPPANSRKLYDTLEGVDRMIRAFTGLKDDLLHPTRVRWDWVHLEKVENLMGRRLGDFPISRAKALSEAVEGEFKYLEESDGAGLEGYPRQAWARDQFAGLIDREVERLEAHRTTFDLDDVARERTESVDRVLFDASKEATAARKYEAAAERSLYRALQELRRLQADKVKRAVQEENAEPELASFCPGDEVIEPDQPAEPETPAPARTSEPSRRSYRAQRESRSR